MSDKTGIEWTDATWNPVTGCTKVSAGCKHCYAKYQAWPRLSAMPNTVYTGRDFENVMCHHERLEQPLRWAKPRLIFVNSMSDLFHEDVPDEFIDKVFAVMALAPQHTFQVLTKRPERMLRHPMFSHSGNCLWVGVRQEAERMFGKDPGPINKILPNVWIGVSVEDQDSANERIPLLLQTPAAVRWISAEPLLGGVNLERVELNGGCFDALRGGPVSAADWPGINWVVAGGESGPKARPMHPDWVCGLRDQCEAAGVPFLFKQWGEWEVASTANGHYDGNMETNKAVWVHTDGVTTNPSVFRTDGGNTESAYAMVRVGKKRAGRLLDGVQHDGYPKGGAA